MDRVSAVKPGLEVLCAAVMVYANLMRDRDWPRAAAVAERAIVFQQRRARPARSSWFGPAGEAAEFHDPFERAQVLIDLPFRGLAQQAGNGRPHLAGGRIVLEDHG